MSAALPRVTPQPQDVYNHFARLSADQQLAVVFEFDGRLDESHLREAVETVVASQPVLGCRFTYDAGRAAFEPADRAGLVTVAAADDARDVVRSMAAEPLDYAGAGVFHVTLVRGAGRDALAMRIDHVAVDGQGAKGVAGLLAGAYSGRVPPATAGAAPDRSAARLMRRFSVAERVRAFRGRSTVRPTWGAPSLGGEPGRRGHAVSAIEPEHFSAVRSRAKAAGATVNDVLLAAFYRALFARLGPPAGKPMAVNVSFDMRRYLDPADPMPAACNLSSIETALLERIDGEPFDGTLARAVEQTARLKAGSPGLGSAVLLEYSRLLGYRRVERIATEPMARGRAHGVSFPFLSNFGVLPPDDLTFGGEKPASVVILPPVGHPPFVMLGPSTYEGRLSVAVGYAEGETDAAATRAFTDGIARDVVAWACDGEGAISCAI